MSKQLTLTHFKTSQATYRLKLTQASSPKQDNGESDLRGGPRSSRSSLLPRPSMLQMGLGDPTGAGSRRLLPQPREVACEGRWESASV